MKKIFTAALAALAGFAASASAQVSANFSDLVLGFRATGNPGQNINLEVNLGRVSQFTGLASGSVMTVTGLSAADLASIYGTNWNTRTDLFWGVIGTAGRLVGGPGGQPVGTLWATNAQATVGTQSSAWIPSSRNGQFNASATIETVFFAAPGSLNGKASTANSSIAAAVTSTLSGSYTAQATIQPGTSFGFFNPSIDNSAKVAANAYAVSDLYELQPGATSATYVGSFALSSAGQLYFTKSATYFNPPSVTTQPANQSPAAGGSTTLTAAGSGTVTYQWQKNGTNLPASVAGSTTASINLTNVQPADTGIYAAVVSSTGSSISTNGAIVGVTTTNKTVGGTEIGANIQHPNGNFYDQVRLDGAAASVTADAGQVTRMSYIDLTNDIVQIEFAGPGTLSVVLDNASGPAEPVNYSQAGTLYMKGHAGIVITGATKDTNVSVFSVGRLTAFDPTGTFNFLLPVSATNDPSKNGSSLFVGHASTVYDGMADLAFIAISSSDGKFGGVRTSNASYYAAKGMTGVYAPGVQFTGPIFIGDITASDNATPVIQIGSTTDVVRITGGDLAPGSNNAKGVTISGFTQLQFRDGITSNNGALPAQAIKGRLIQAGLDVTSTVALAPGQ